MLLIERSATPSIVCDVIDVMRKFLFRRKPGAVPDAEQVLAAKETVGVLMKMARPERLFHVTVQVTQLIVNIIDPLVTSAVCVCV